MKGTKQFSKSALLTPANAITLLRVMLVPIVVDLFLRGPSWFLTCLWFIVSVTDALDGIVARRMGTTNSGAFLDPLADKIVVIAALVVLVVSHRVNVAPVIIISAREFAMSVFRMLRSKHNVSVPARKSAKMKTLMQDVAIGLYTLPTLRNYDRYSAFLLYFAAALTITTFYQYLRDYFTELRLNPKGVK